MRKKILWVTETSVMLALLVVLQAVTKPLGQLVTGSCVNAVLAITVLFCGLSSGITVALISPVCAYLLGIAPQILTVPVIMVGNTALVSLLYLIGGRSRFLWKKAVAWISAAVCKFVFVFILVNYGICGILAEPLLAQGTLKPPMLIALPATFGITQLFTALIGGALALALTPILRKALHKI